MDAWLETMRAGTGFGGIAHSGFRDTPINPESAGLKSYFAADGRVVVESDLTMRGFHADDLRDAWSRREEWMCNFGTPTNNGAFFWGFGWWSVKTGVSSTSLCLRERPGFEVK